jgi:hypothetical protein
VAANIKLILAAPPEQLQGALAFGLPIAHMAYRMASGMRLLRSQQLAPAAKGGFLMMDDAGFDGKGDAASFCRAVLRECTLRSFSGVILDWEGEVSPLACKLIGELAARMSRSGRILYVPEPFANCSPQTRVIISSALSGGSLAYRLKEAIKQYGLERITLGVERVCEDFFLPAPTGRGVPISHEALKQRLAERSPSVFFSRELCANYFTYMSKETGAHLVLFDDAASIRKKLETAAELNIREAILAFPQVADLLPEVVQKHAT